MKKLDLNNADIYRLVGIIDEKIERSGDDYILTEILKELKGKLLNRKENVNINQLTII